MNVFIVERTARNAMPMDNVPSVTPNITWMVQESVFLVILDLALNSVERVLVDIS